MVIAITVGIGGGLVVILLIVILVLTFLHIKKVHTEDMDML
jgi:hypothetical protein